MLTAIVRFKILEQAHGQSPFRFTVADLDRPVRAKRLDGREILPVYWRLSKHLRWRQRLQREALACESAAAEFVSIALPSSQIEIEMPGGAVARVCNDRQSLRPLVEQQLGTGAVARVGATVRDNHGCPQVLPSAGPH